LIGYIGLNLLPTNEQNLQTFFTPLLVFSQQKRNLNGFAGKVYYHCLFETIANSFR